MWMHEQSQHYGLVCGTVSGTALVACCQIQKSLFRFALVRMFIGILLAIPDYAKTDSHPQSAHYPSNLFAVSFFYSCGSGLSRCSLFATLLGCVPWSWFRWSVSILYYLVIFSDLDSPSRFPSILVKYKGLLLLNVLRFLPFYLCL